MESIEPEKTNIFKKIFSLKVIVLGLLIAFGVEGYFVVKSFRQPTISPPPKVEDITGGEIFLIASKDKMSIGENTRVAMRISTGGYATQGTDVILKFDPKYFEASTSSIYKGGVYPDYPVVLLDNKQGTLKMSGLSPTNLKTFKGVGIFGFLDLKAKKTGETKITVYFEKNRTDESNIVEAETSKDILEKVNHLDFNILPEDLTNQ